MTNTLKDYIDELIPYKQFISISEFSKQLHDSKRQAELDKLNIPHIKLAKPRGCITLASIFDRSYAWDLDDRTLGREGDSSFIDDISAFFTKFGSWEVNDYTERYNLDPYYSDNDFYSAEDGHIDLSLFTIVNPKGKAFESKDILLMKVRPAGISNDVKSEYTKIIINVFDNDLNSHYDLYAFGADTYEVADCSFKIDNHPYIAEVTQRLVGSEQYIDISSYNSNIELDMDQLTQEPSPFDPSDKNSIRRAIAEIMDTDPAKIKNLDVNYVSKYIC